MEGEVELVTEPRTNQGWCNDVTVSGEVEVEKPEPVDEHAVDDCIKDWQLGLRSYEAPAQESVTGLRPGSRRTVRTATTTKLADENTKPGSTDTAGSGCTSPSRLESSNHAGSSTVENLGLPDCSKDSRLGRGVSFSESSRIPSPPSTEAQMNEAPSTAQDSSKGCAAKCVEAREGNMIVHPPGASPLPLPELGLLRQSQRQQQDRVRHSCAQVRPLDPIGEGSCKFDSSSRRDFMSGPLASSQSQTELEDDSHLNSPSVLLRCNARRQHDEEEDDDDDEDFKVGLFCGRGLAYTNASRGDFVRLLSKLCLAVPVSKQSAASKVSSQDYSRSSGREVSSRSSSGVSSQVYNSSWENNNQTSPSDDYVVFGRQNTLKLLCERCSNESETPSYNAHCKPRKIRDHEPHQHFYKTISKTLDRKLRS